MNGKDAEDYLDSLVVMRKLERVSKPGRTKAVIYQALSNRTLAVIPESLEAKIVFELHPGGRTVDWDTWVREAGAKATGQQLATSGLKGRDARALRKGKQKVIVVANRGQLEILLDYYL